MDLLADARGMVASWLARVVIAFAVIGTVLFDAGAVAVNYMGLESTARDIVYALRSNEEGMPNPRELEEQAGAMAAEAGARLLSAEVDPQGVLRVRIRRRAKTLLAQRFEALKDLTRPVATARADTA